MSDITREEAIQILKDDVMIQSGWANQLSGFSRDIADGRIEAHKMGIEALENQKTGHWIEKNVNQDGTHNIYCSNCNNYLKFKGHANSYNARTKLKYCPNCGAKMLQ